MSKLSKINSQRQDEFSPISIMSKNSHHFRLKYILQDPNQEPTFHKQIRNCKDKYF
jgi:hypothetical protein